MRYLSPSEILTLHERIILQSGGSFGLRDLGAFESAAAQPMMTYGGHDLYAGVAEKAVALCYSLIMNHPFVDGNKRIGHAAMETFLVLNGYELSASMEEQEATILALASSELNREEFLAWLNQYLIQRIRSKE